jgi:DNA-binding PadR family transcriptional regulator
MTKYQSMPKRITRKEFEETGKGSLAKRRILSFLSNNPNYAFSLYYIFDKINQDSSFKVPFGTLTATLTKLKHEGLVLHSRQTGKSGVWIINKEKLEKVM